MSERLKGALLATTAGLVLSSCASEAAPPVIDKKPTAPSCQFDTARDLSDPPTNLNFDRVAQALGVESGLVEDGVVVPVTCDPGIPVENFNAGTPVETLDIPGELGIAPDCLPLISDVPYSAGAVATRPFVLCPAARQTT